MGDKGWNRGAGWLLGCAALLGACATTPAESRIEVREIHTQVPVPVPVAEPAVVPAVVPKPAGVEAAAGDRFRACREEGLAMDRLARASGNAGQYLTSARLLAGCEARLGNAVAGIGRSERLRVLALAAQNYAKGGDVEAGRAVLERIGAGFPDHDLYYPDGTSVRATLAMALGLDQPEAGGDFAVANVNPVLKAELRRARYWQQH